MALRQLWSRLTSFNKMVGRDLEGNKFYEYPSPHGISFKTKRVVEYAKRMELWEYPQAQRRLPVQWTMWLTHTRSQAPTIEELHADLARQARVQHNVALLQARDAEAAAPRLSEPEHEVEPARTTEQSTSSAQSNAQPAPQRELQPTPELPAVEQSTPPQEPPTPSPWAPADQPVESQQWKPAVGRRGVGR